MCLMLVMASTMACSSSSPKTKVPVKVVMVPYFGTWMNNYAVMNGLVTSDKVDVTIDLTTSNDAQLLAGAYPIGAMSITGFATATEKSNIAFQAMGIYLADTGFDSGLGVDIVYTKADSKLTSPRDLIGKKVGVPGLQTAAAGTFLGLLKSVYGISETQMTLVDSPAPQLITLLTKGDLDAALLLADPSVQTFYNPSFRALWNVDQAFEHTYGTYNPATFLVVQTDYLKNNRDVVKAVYDLLKQSGQYGKEHLAELSLKYVAEKGGSADLYQTACKDHYSVTFDPVEGQLQASVMAIFGFVKDRGIISKLPDPATVFMKW
jgi:ABC-type nitrate/sulfonate/bicarbonate transport system substrate-binding protein